MPRGITESDVWKACDALLLEGARPTIERVRQKIGSGSPNTVSPFLDAWFRHLGSRIRDPGAFAAPPDIPDEIQQAAKHFWEAALARTRGDFDERLSAGMAAAVANVEAEKERAAVADASAFEAAAKAARLQSELVQVKAQLDQQRTARAADAAHLENALRRAEDLGTRLVAMEHQLGKTRDAARADVELARERAATSERRAMLEIDAERVARAKADKRAAALESKLEKTLAEARHDKAAALTAALKLQAEKDQLARQIEEADAARQLARQEADRLSQQLNQAQRDHEFAKGEAMAAHTILARLRPAASKIRSKRAPAR